MIRASASTTSYVKQPSWQALMSLVANSLEYNWVAARGYVSDVTSITGKEWITT